jgi:tetratricopeptide (TPR) repeat protein
LEQAVRARPTNAIARHALGAAFLMLNQNQEALNEWETAERLAPGSPNQYNLSGFIGCAFMKLGHWEAALVRFDQSIRLLPTFFFAHYYRAIVLEFMGQGDAAIAAMRRARAVDTELEGFAWEARTRAYVESWWRNHPDLPIMLAAVQRLSNATQGDA